MYYLVICIAGLVYDYGVPSSGRFRCSSPVKPPDRLIEECGRCLARRTQRSPAARRGGSNWWKPWATGPWRVDGTTHSITVAHAHTHAFGRVLRTPLELFDPADTLKVTRQATGRTSIAINVRSMAWTRTDLRAQRRQSFFWWGGTFKNFWF